jgi:hypothetical protein
MNPSIRLGALALTALLAAPVQAGSVHSGATAAPANSIVGLWSTEGLVGPCGVTPGQLIFNTLLFHAGGTVVETPRFPPAGLGGFQRSQALGTWWYDPATRRHALHLRYDRYLDSAYAGYTTIDREFAISPDSQMATGPVRVNNYSATGTPTTPEICGDPVSERL